MAFQYNIPKYQQQIYPNLPYNNGFYSGAQNQIAPLQNQNFYNQNFYNQYTSNPYQRSFYNEGLNYPYSPNFAPQINLNPNQNYFNIGSYKTENGDFVHVYKLKNGQNVVIMPKKNVGTMVKTYLNAGSMNESDELRGISHTIEHMLFKGSSKFKDGDVFRLTGKMGASTNASTDYANTDYYITAPYLDKEDLKTVVELQGDMISNPLFEKSALESEKNPICSEISMMDDRAQTRAFDRAIRNLFQINSSSHNLVAGSISTVQNLKQEDLISHHEKYYAPQDLTTVVVGDVEPNSTIDLISKNFNVKLSNSQNEQYRETLNPIKTPKREDYKSSKTNLTNVLMAFSGPTPKNSKDFVIGQMIEYYLNSCSTSAFKKGLEDFGGDYDFAYQKVGLGQNDPFAIVNSLALPPENEQKGVDLFYDSIIKLQNEKLTDEEMAAIRNFQLKFVEYENCDSENIAEALASEFRYGTLDTFLNKKQIVQSITKEDIQNFARKYLDLNKISMVVVHPSSVSDSEIQKNYQESKYSNSKKMANLSFTGSIPNISTSNVKQYKMANNTTLAINTTNSDICAFKWSVATPPLKAKNPNIPLVLTYMLQKGSEYLNQDELERYKELNGISLDVQAYGKSFEITADCMVQNSSKTLALMNEVMYHPKLTQSDFDTAKKQVKAILKGNQKDASSPLLDKLYPGFFPTDSKMLSKIDELTLDDIKDFYRQLLENGSSFFVASVPNNRYPFIENTILEYQNSSCCAINFKDKVEKPAPIYRENETETVIYDTDDLNQAQIYKTYQFPLSGNIQDEAKFELVNTILGGSSSARLFADLREKENLAYSVYSSINSFENTGVLSLEIQTTTDNPEQNVVSYDNVQKSLEGFKKHTDKMCQEYVTDEELESAKTRLKQKLIAQTHNPLASSELLYMNMIQPYGIKRIDKYLEAIDSITKEDIKQAANFIFSRKPTISILASENTINSQMEYLKTQGEVIHA